MRVGEYGKENSGNFHYQERVGGGGGEGYWRGEKQRGCVGDITNQQRTGKQVGETHENGGLHEIRLVTETTRKTRRVSLATTKRGESAKDGIKQGGSRSQKVTDETRVIVTTSSTVGDEDHIGELQERFQNSYEADEFDRDHMVSIEKKLDLAWGEEEDENGVRREGAEEVEALVLGYFEKIFSANVNYVPERAVCDVPNRVTEAMNSRLTRRITSEEVKVAVFDMPTNKSPGPDGMTYLNHNKAGRDTSMALKLDMSKAYDRVEWNFLIAIMSKLGFSRIWFSEGLTTMLRKTEERKCLTSIKINRGSPSISNILFADDTFIFCKASVDEARVVIKILEDYELASGQKVNMGKFSVSFEKRIRERNMRSVVDILRMVEASFLYKVLKGRYFRNCSFLNAKGTNFHIRAAEQEGPKWVSQLIVEGDWDKEKVGQVLEGEDVECVLAIPLSTARELRKNGELHGGKTGESSAGLSSEPWWKQLWHLQVPPKWTKINCDAGWEKEIRKCSIGVVVHDDQGQFKGAIHKSFDMVDISVVVEALAICE
ncbi:hypothetical protein LIER_21037 [Lithospermum erythrorhizon]|uniref:Reverse transcriptase domain-containing protein n=1 Tax=Lithospermum erythrorhizon TaxID=34254 RepID=A0AAV3QS63_LITER